MPLTYNVQCKTGHRWFCLNPEAWIGRVCGHTYDRRTDGSMADTGRCQSTLGPLQPPKVTRQEIPL